MLGKKKMKVNLNLKRLFKTVPKQVDNNTASRELIKISIFVLLILIIKWIIKNGINTNLMKIAIILLFLNSAIVILRMKSNKSFYTSLCYLLSGLTIVSFPNIVLYSSWDSESPKNYGEYYSEVFLCNLVSIIPLVILPKQTELRVLLALAMQLQTLIVLILFSPHPLKALPDQFAIFLVLLVCTLGDTLKSQKPAERKYIFQEDLTIYKHAWSFYSKVPMLMIVKGNQPNDLKIIINQHGLKSFDVEEEKEAIDILRNSKFKFENTIDRENKPAFLNIDQLLCSIKKDESYQILCQPKFRENLETNLQMTIFKIYPFENQNIEKEVFLVSIRNQGSFNESKQQFEKNEHDEEEIGKWLAHFSHTLRTPLNIIIGLLDSARSLISEKITLKLLKVASRSAENLSFTINDILDFNILQTSSSLKLKPKSVAINPLINRVIKLVKYRVKKKGLAFRYTNEINSKTQVLVDSERMMQILINILNYSLQHTTSGFISLRVLYDDSLDEPDDVKEEESEGSNKEKQAKIPERYVMFCVEDSSNELTNKRFDLMMSSIKLIKKSESVSATEFSMGVSSQIARLMSPNMEKNCFLNEKLTNGGNCFKLRVITSKCTNDDYFESKSINGMENSEKNFPLPIRTLPDCKWVRFSRKKFRALIVDDDPFNIMVVSFYLDSFKQFIYEKASNGAEAVEMYKRCNQTKSIFEKDTTLLSTIQWKTKDTIRFHSEPTFTGGCSTIVEEDNSFDIVLMDCNMPIMDGLQAATIIKELSRKGLYKYVPVMALTANAELAQEDACLKSGMISIMTKPIHKESFKVKLEEILGIKIES